MLVLCGIGAWCSFIAVLLILVFRVVFGVGLPTCQTHSNTRRVILNTLLLYLYIY